MYLFPFTTSADLSINTNSISSISAILTNSSGELASADVRIRALNNLQNLIVCPSVNNSKNVFKNIGGFDGFDIRLDDMIQDDDRLLYNVYDNCSGTATRPAGLELRNDVLNSIRRANTGIILDFSNVKTVSSSFIDEFIAKMVLDLGFSKFNNIVKIIGMNDTIEYLCNRAVFMRIHTEWSKINNQNKDNVNI